MEGYIGEVRLFAGNFAPLNWAFCEGQTMSIASNNALFALIGTTYGGNGTTTFNLPNTQSRVVIGEGQGPGLTNRVIGQMSGTETVTLTVNQMPMHTHLLVNSLHATATQKAFNDTATSDEPENNYYALSESGAQYSPTKDAQMAPSTGTITGTITASNAGGSQPHTNLQPVTAIYYIICLYGIFPSRN